MRWLEDYLASLDEREERLLLGLWTEADEDEYADRVERLWWRLTDEEQTAVRRHVGDVPRLRQ